MLFSSLLFFSEVVERAKRARMREDRSYSARRVTLVGGNFARARLFRQL